MMTATARTIAISLAFFLGLAKATSSQSFPPVEGGTGIFTLPVEPPFPSDDTSIIQITIITPTLTTSSVTDPLPESTTSSVAETPPASTGSAPSSGSLPTNSSSIVASDTVTVTSTTALATSPTNAPSDTPTTSSPNPAATVTAFVNHAVALAAALGLGMAM